MKKKMPQVVKRLNYVGIAKDIGEQNWDEVLNSKDVNRAVEKFTIILQKIMERNEIEFTQKKSNVKLKPWITDTLIKQIRERDRLHMEVRKKPNDQDLNKSYKIYRNRTAALIKKTKTEYYANRIEDCPFNSKEMWKTLRGVINNETKQKENRDPTSILMKGEKLTNRLSIVQAFNYHYTNIADTIKIELQEVTEESLETKNLEDAKQKKSDKKRTPIRSWVKFKPMTQYSVRKIINNLKPYAAAGSDRITPRIIKENCDKLLTPITYLTNLSMNTGIFPTLYKEAIIRPIYKGGNEEDINNYRPVSLISNISKIIEKAIKNQLIEYLEDNKYFVESQTGFRKNMGTEDAINKLHIELTTNLDNGKKCIVVFQDLSKAFDLVDHKKLVTIIKEAGCGGKVLEWFQSYLDDRKQKVRIGETESENLKLKNGTPQGSALSPILFIIYMNELGKIELKGKLISYADDTVLIEIGETWEEVKQNTEEDLRKIINWLNNHKMILNLKKTNFIQFGLKNKKTEEDIRILIHHKKCTTNNHKGETECREMLKVKHSKYLGVIIDKNLNWKEHIKVLATKLLKPIYLAIQIKNMIPNRTKRLIYMAMVQSKLQYGISSWGATYKTNLKPVIRNQKKFLKILFNKPKRYSTIKLFNEINVPTIEELHEVTTLKYVKKHGHLTNITMKPKETRYNTLTIQLPHVKTNSGKLNSKYKGIQNFNKLDLQDKEIITNATITQYKKAIRTVTRNRRKRRTHTETNN